MAENGASEALERIGRALGRIEAALERPTNAPTQDLAMAELKARHDSLRGETRAALADLDALIARAGGRG